MNQQQTIELEVRLSAIEYMLTKLSAAMIVASGKSGDELAQGFRELAAGAHSQMFPGLDPALSDLASAEWGRAIERLLDMQKKIVSELRG